MAQRRMLGMVIVIQARDPRTRARITLILPIIRGPSIRSRRTSAPNLL